MGFIVQTKEQQMYRAKRGFGWMLWIVAAAALGLIQCDACGDDGSDDQDAALVDATAQDGATTDGASDATATSRGSVVGRVLAVNGTTEDVVAGAKIQIGKLETTSDDNGLFELNDVPAGKATIEVHPDIDQPQSYSSTTIFADVAANGEVQVTAIVLPRCARTFPPARVLT